MPSVRLSPSTRERLRRRDGPRLRPEDRREDVEGNGDAEEILEADDQREVFAEASQDHTADIRPEIEVGLPAVAERRREDDPREEDRDEDERTRDDHPARP